MGNKCVRFSFLKPSRRTMSCCFWTERYPLWVSECLNKMEHSASFTKYLGENLYISDFVLVPSNLKSSHSQTWRQCFYFEYWDIIQWKLLLLTRTLVIEGTFLVKAVLISCLMLWSDKATSFKIVLTKLLEDKVCLSQSRTGGNTDFPFSEWQVFLSSLSCFKTWPIYWKILEDQYFSAKWCSVGTCQG